VFYTGDSGYHTHFADIRRRLGPVDAALIPIGAYEPRWFMSVNHMNPEEAVRAHLDLGSPLSVAMHFGCFQLTDEPIDEPVRELARARDAHGVAATAFRVLEPGETLAI
jgi:N-acyl-phosphatidylethanolamine-hydrolysing phospholipase D